MFLDPLLDLFRGRAVTIPPMDGALKPNTLLDEAPVIATVKAPDSVVWAAGRVVYASGSGVFALGQDAPMADFGVAVCALAAAPDGTLAVGLDDGRVMVGDREVATPGCPTALAFDGGSLLVANGSDAVAASDWVGDLMRRKASGSLWRIDLAGGQKTCLADGLAFPSGVVADPATGRVVFSEAWAHRLASVPAAGGRAEPVLTRLPAYPGRLSVVTGGYLLALFAPLNRLVEFVLREDRYRDDMMREIDSRHWIAPTLTPAASFLEPLQNGGVRSMGVHKPWSPSRSYGLLVRLDAEFRPVASYHSRANGLRHGVTSAIEADGATIVAVKGGDMIVRLEPVGGTP